jgi:hypothetical protein
MLDSFGGIGLQNIVWTAVLCTIDYTAIQQRKQRHLPSTSSLRKCFREKEGCCLMDV